MRRSAHRVPAFRRGSSTARAATLAALLLTFSLLSVSANGVTPSSVHFPDARRPEVLDRFELPPTGLLALAITADGRRAALAVVVQHDRRDPTSEVTLHDLGAPEPTRFAVMGRVRTLLFDPGSGELYGIEHRPAKKREGDTYLLRFDRSEAKARRETRLPPSARDLVYWPHARSFLLASRDDLRAISLPVFRSGQLYRVPGENRSVAVLSGTRVLVGQDSELLLIDLADPQERHSIPIRERIPTPAPVTAIAIGSDGSRGLARLADERVVTIVVEPLSIAEYSTGLVVNLDAAGPVSNDLEPPAARPDDRAPPVEPAPVEIEPEVAEPVRPAETETPAPVPAVEPEPRDPLPSPEPPEFVRAAETETPPPVPAVEPEPREPTPSPEPRVAESEPEDAEPDEPSVPPAPVAPPDEKPAEPVQLRGRLTGAFAERVVAVVLFGPDNLLREATRVAPGPDGTYSIGGLPDGRYRIQLDGGGSRVLISRPASMTVAIGSAGTAVADFEVVDVL